MPAPNPCNYEEAYQHYLITKNISETSEFFKKRRSVVKREFLKLGFKYPLDSNRDTDYNINQPPRKDFFLKENYFEKIDNPVKAYFLGLIYADGCITIRKNIKKGNKYAFRISLTKTDGHILEELAKELGTTVKNIFCAGQPVTGNIHSDRVYYKKDMVYVSVDRRDFVNHLFNSGVLPNKTYKNMSIPKTDFVKDFIRGYFDGDGCIGVYKRKFNGYTTHCYIISKTDNLLKEIKEFLGKSINCYIKEYNDLFYLRIRQCSVLDFWDIIKPDENVITMKRKADKFQFYRSFLEQSKNEKSDELLEKPEEVNQQPS